MAELTIRISSPGRPAIGTNAIHDLTGAERSASTASPAVERRLPGSLEGGPSPGADLPKTRRAGMKACATLQRHETQPDSHLDHTLRQSAASQGSARSDEGTGNGRVLRQQSLEARVR